MSGLEDILAAVTAEIRKKASEWQQQESLWSVLTGFFHAIDWKEPWIMGILATHVLLLVAAVVTRKIETAQLTLFLSMMTVVLNAENLNELGRRHWTKFAGQPYFDEAGAFISAVVSGPFMFIMFVLLINYLRSCFNMMVIAKRKELVYKARQRKKTEAAAAGGTGVGNSGETGGTGGTPNGSKAGQSEGKKSK